MYRRIAEALSHDMISVFGYEFRLPFGSAEMLQFF